MGLAIEPRLCFLGQKDSRFTHKKAQGTLKIYDLSSVQTSVRSHWCQQEACLPGRAPQLSSFSALLVPDQTRAVAALSVDVLASKSRETAPFLLAPGAPHPGSSPSLLRDCFGILTVYKPTHIGPVVTCGSPHSIAMGSSNTLSHPPGNQNPELPGGVTAFLSYCLRVEEHSVVHNSLTHLISCGLANPVRQEEPMNPVPSCR